MPQFHLNLRRGQELIEDDEPQEFADLAAAREDAVQSLRELAAHALQDGKSFEYTGIEITDPHGAVLTVVEATEAVPELR
jgi:hypothetical protein